MEDESRGGWYVRQLPRAANIEGAPRVRAICERYGLPYNTGPLSRQLGMVHRTIVRLALPGGKPRRKPGPYQGDPEAARERARLAAAA